jgi:hypothetical protein
LAVLPLDQLRKYFMVQNNRPPSKPGSGPKRSSVPKVDDLVSRMHELRRLREQVVQAESGQRPKAGATASAAMRPAGPK